MKVVVVSIFLLMSIIGDFTSEVFAIDHLDTSCHVSVCAQSDLHTNNQKDNQNQKSNEGHCHCHAGHLHVVIFYSAGFDSASLISNQYDQPYGSNHLKLQKYLSESIRPPIA